MAGEIIGDLLRLTVLGGLGVAGVLTVLIWKKNMATRVTFLRFVIQAIAVAAIFYVLSYTIPPITGGLPPIQFVYVLIVILSMTIFLGRFFCGWLCPFAFIMDLESLLRKALKDTSPNHTRQTKQDPPPITICHINVFFIVADSFVAFGS